MKVDVVIPVYKPGALFVSLIEGLKKQTLCPNKIIVINTGKELFDAFTTAFSFDCEKEGIMLYHISKEEFDHAGTRHIGIEMSDADVVVMMTQDAIPYDKTLLEKLVNGLSEGVAVSYARQLPGDNSGELEKLSREFNYPEKSMIKSKEDIERIGIKAFFCSDVCAAYNRKLYYEVGGFGVPAIFNEDMVFAYNALMKGYKVSYTSDACVVHSHSYTCMQQFHRNFDLGVSQAEHPEVFSTVKSETEGKKLVKNAWKNFCKRKKPYLFVPFAFQCFFKLLGYKLGKNYRKLPMKAVRRMSQSAWYWDRKEQNGKQ